VTTDGRLNSQPYSHSGEPTGTAEFPRYRKLSRHLADGLAKCVQEGGKANSVRSEFGGLKRLGLSGKCQPERQEILGIRGNRPTFAPRQLVVMHDGIACFPVRVDH